MFTNANCVHTVGTGSQNDAVGTGSQNDGFVNLFPLCYSIAVLEEVHN